MADPKSIAALYNYDPRPAPLRGVDVGRYLQAELSEIGARLNVLTETFMPSVTVGLTNLSNPITFTADPVFTPLDNYDLGIASDFLSYVGLVFDPVAGTISFTGGANEFYTVEITAAITFRRDTLGFNEQVFMRVADLTSAINYRFASAFIVSNLQTLFQLSGSTVIEVNGDSVLQLEVAADIGGLCDSAIGTFAVRPVTNRYLVRPNG